MRCSACGEDNTAGSRFCRRCGAALVADGTAPREVRKVVTVVFCDLSGSTALGDTTDPEALRATMRRYYERARRILERHGGTVEKFVGDAVMAVFGVPVAHEDDALRAVRAAWELRDAIPALGLAARIGVNTGEVVAGEGDSLVTGDAVNVAARLEQAAEPGQVLIGAATRGLVRDAVQVEPQEVVARGKPAPVAAFRLVDVDPEAAPIARRFDIPLVGRRFELAQLAGIFERAVRERRCHLFTLLGPAGVGKSRLVREFLDRLDATVAQSRCLDYGEGITFWPVTGMLKQLGSRTETTIARIDAGASMPNELFWAVRSQLEEIAAERPLVVVFDDIQWGEPTFLDLIDHVADLSRGAPLLVICVARPELLEKRPGWGGGKVNATTLLLEPLGVEECDELIAAHGGVEPERRGAILAAADGNPLFLEEMVALAHDGGDGGTPGSVQALLQARLDQLGGDERIVIERGAVEGNVFHRTAVLELTGSPDVEPQLTGLVRKELIQPAAATFADDQAFRFRHLLIRDAAYDSLPKETRAELHERFAGWLEEHVELVELDEIVGHHLEQAARYRRELGTPRTELERRAGRALAAAGRRAANRSDGPGAQSLLRRALALLPEGDEQRAPVLLAQLGVLEGSGAVDERLRVIDELERSGDERLRLHGRLDRLLYRLTYEPRDALGDVTPAVADALRIFAAHEDDLGAVRAHELASMASWLQSLAVPTADSLAQAIEHARRIDATGSLDHARLMLSGALAYGPFDADEVRARLAAIREPQTATSRYLDALAAADLASRAGRHDEAQVHYDEALAIADNLGVPVLQVFPPWQQVFELQRAGRLDEAAETCRGVVERFEQLGLVSFRSTALIDLAGLLLARGNDDEAQRLVEEGQGLGAAEDVVNFARGQGLRARIAAERGDPTAEALGREALDHAYRTDFPSVHAEAHEALAEALRAAGRRDEAAAEDRRALDLWERYDFLVEADRARARLAAS